MPEPVTIALVSVTVISVAVCAYKGVEKMANAPKEIIAQTGRSAEDLVKVFSAEVRKLFGAEPRISINGQVMQRAAEPICELALYQQSIEIREEWVNKSWGSTKKVNVVQPFNIKAGFDLNRLKFDFDRSRKVLKVTVSDSLLVNVQYDGPFQFLREEHGFWNRISAKERDAIANSLPEKAREKAGELGLRERAMEQLGLFLRRLAGDQLEIELQCDDYTIFFEKGRALPEVPNSTLDALGLVRESVEKQEAV